MPGAIRKLKHREKELFYGHLLRFDKDDRRMRFCAVTSDETIRRYCFERRPFEAIVLGYFVDGELRGASEVIFSAAPLWPMTSEVALSVEGPFQDRGVGTEILRRLIVVARNRWVGRIHMLWLAENVKMQTIATKFDPTLIAGTGQVECEIRPAWPTHLSVMDEVLAETASMTHLWLRQNESAVWSPGGQRPRRVCSLAHHQLPEIATASALAIA